MARNQNYKSSKFSIDLFADDTAFWRTGMYTCHLTKSIQIDINNLQRWSENWGIKLSKLKTVSMIFKNKLKGNIPLKLTLNNSLFAQVIQVKFLDVSFEQALTFKPHINYVVDKCKSGLNLLRVLCGTNWGGGGGDRKMLLCIYNAYVFSILQYGTPAFCCAKPEALARLDVALKVIANTFFATPTVSIQVELGVMPLSPLRTKLCFNYWVEVKNITPKTQ